MSKKPKAGRGPKAAGKKEVAKTQSERFIEAARDAGVDESGREFERALARLIKPKLRARK